MLLDVERAGAAASAQNVRLVVALAERSSTLGHFEVATRPTLSQPAAQSILQNELVAARILSSERWNLDN